MQFFAFLSSNIFGSGLPAWENTGSNLKRAAAAIKQNYNTPISINELAKGACLSRSHFLHSFKKAFGVSPVQYQLRLRINSATELLAGTSMSCKEIAAAVGMGNVYYFSKMFKRSTGLTPTEYRTRNQLW